MPGSQTAQGRSGARSSAPERVAFRPNDGVGTPDEVFSRLNGWPTRTPVNASRHALRPLLAHDSGTVRFAEPLPSGTFTHYSLPVYPALPLEHSTTRERRG